MTTPLTWIEAPVRQPRPNTSLDVLPVHDVSAEHFVGFQFIPEPCSFPNNVPQDCYVQVGPAPGTQKTFNDVEDAIVLDVFGAYHGIACYLNGGVDNFREMARNVLENGEHKVVDQALAAALAANDTSVSGPVTAVQALALLEQAIADEVPAQGFIFVSPTVATYLAANTLVVRNLDGSLETYLGTPVVVLTELTATLVAFASGPVNIWRTPVTVTDTQTWTQNMASALAERLYALSIECGVWSVTFTAPAPTSGGGGEPVPLSMLLGSVPASPIPDGTDTTLNVYTNQPPVDEVYIHYSINGGAWQVTPELTQVTPTHFVHNVVGGETTTGDSVELYAKSGTTESNHIVIEVI